MNQPEHGHPDLQRQLDAAGRLCQPEHPGWSTLLKRLPPQAPADDAPAVKKASSRRKSSPWRIMAMAACLGFVLVGVLLGGVVGADGTNPFDMTPVSGKIAYRDGALIPGLRIVIEFSPQGEAIGAQYPRPGRADVDASDGTFAEVSTQKFADGLIRGRHKIRALSCDQQNNLTELEVTPAEIEIGEETTRLVLTVKRP